MVIAFIDMLGTKAKWHEGGREGAQAAFDRFRDVVRTALESVKPHAVKSGAIESDSCALVFRDAASAITVAKAAYLAAFRSARSRQDERLWLRGAVVDASRVDALRARKRLSGAMPQVERFEYNPDLLDAIAVEKSGFKGMRLLLHAKLVTPELCDAFRIEVGKRVLMPFRKLDNSIYPGRLGDDYQDFLWMADADEAEWEANRLLMASRLRWSSRNQEEFVHAAATQVVFHECTAILSSLQYRR
jgi:hypothetical protein